MPTAIVIIGAGVSGLTSALLLSKSKGNAVTIVAKHMPGDYHIEYASPWAGANVLPMADRENSRWERRTWPELKRLAEHVPEAGIHFQGKAFAANPLKFARWQLTRDPWYAAVLPDFRELHPDELVPGHESGCEFTSVCINTATYLQWLLGQCLRNGVVVRRAVLADISEAGAMSHTGAAPASVIIINATGLGSLKLGGVRDLTMLPVRGQTVLVRNECHPMITTSGTDDGDVEVLYIMQRAGGGGTILGGTFDPDNWAAEPDPNISIRIMRRAIEVCPNLTGGKGIDGLSIIRHGVGLRPYRRDGARIETEVTADGLRIVHNYGHAGWGYQASYGCAERVVELVNELRMDAGEQLVGDFKLLSTDESEIPPGLWNFAVDIATGRHALSSLVVPALWLLDAALCCLIIWRVPYTEIDWVAYMEQVDQFLSGERDYARIEGGTGPLVYPAAHVYIYSGLYYMTDSGKNILLAQKIFAVLYLATLALVMLCYRYAKVEWLATRLNAAHHSKLELQAPPYLAVLLILSKRLHSVFILRCFNDCFAVFFLWLAIFFLQRRSWTLGALAYSWGLGVKMSLLLVLPALAVVLFLGRGFRGSLLVAWQMALFQLVIAVPFLAADWKAYLGRAFELSRQFKFEWTVNWRMLGEQAFISTSFSVALLAAHAAALVIFIATRWMKPAGWPLSAMIPPLLHGQAPLAPREELAASRRVTPEYIMTTVLSANIIGLLFARSLHYQFYAYLYWSEPYLLWKASRRPLLVGSLWLAQEWAWNVFPSTAVSSSVVVGVLTTIVVMVYFGIAEEDDLGAPNMLIEGKNE
ncbi:hypothetical protein L249_4440 [Ophiocordyceps polyrhachis-furcata BCC 54312]|uniref:Dol-P-Man:Man(5)GlcNAc(2)-PP-Dol alpha-1,3-mannosyltransferase n=1 Tax=Ophiocordyceps polyrhachis-furcata BCC 54312 TaxID=1330021 RepID=A0A367L8A6_9HYPO|nr:hypothetical protein L249_4440 [Ophiocordyceps polyrhachis-furcata BCC 54312]